MKTSIAAALGLVSLLFMSVAPSYLDWAPRVFDRACNRSSMRSDRGGACRPASIIPPTPDPTYLEFLPASGAGIPVISHHSTALCDALAAEVPTWNATVVGGAGNWCLGGDGLSVPGSEVTFAYVGTPSTVDTPICPSGLDCLAATGQPIKALQLTTTTMTAATVARASGTQPMTACWWGNLTNRNEVWVLSHGTANTVGGLGFAIYLQAGFSSMKSSDGASVKNAVGSFSTDSAIRLFCVTHPGGSGNSRVWLDGVSGSPSGTAFVRNSVVAKPTLNGANGGALFSEGVNAYGAFYTDRELTSAQLLAISRRILADTPQALIQGVASTNLTYARAGPAFCSRSDNIGTILPAGRPCIAGGELVVEPTATNLQPRSQGFDDATWIKAGTVVAAPIVSPDYGVAPDGSKTAERVQIADCGIGGSQSVIYGTVTSTVNTAHVGSVYFRATDGGSATISAAVYSQNNTPVKIDSSDGGWQRIAAQGVENTGHTLYYLTIGCNNATAYTGRQNTGAQDILLWGAQLETGTNSAATSYTPTVGGSQARGNALASIAGLTPPSTASGCLAASWNQAFRVTGKGIASLEATTTLKQTILDSAGMKFYVGGSQTVSTSTIPTNALHRAIGRWTATTSTLDYDGTVTTGSAGTGATFDVLRIGNYSNAAVVAGRISKIQYDPRDTQCQ